MRAQPLNHRQTLILADDHSLILDGLGAILESDFEILARAKSGEELLDLVEKHRPDLVVTDVSMPEPNGIVATHRIRAMYPETRVVLLSMHPEPEYVVSALEAGASGYVLKHSGVPELRKAIQRVMAGETVIPPSIAEEVRGLMRGRQDHNVSPLSERQLDILRMLADGKTAKQIAAKLGISRKTVEYHKYRLLDLLGASTTAELIRIAIVRGIVLS